MKNLGTALIVIGILMMLITGFNYATSENIVNAGPIQINKKENHPVQWSPIIGGVLLAAGLVLSLSKRKSG